MFPSAPRSLVQIADYHRRRPQETPLIDQLVIGDSKGQLFSFQQPSLHHYVTISQDAVPRQTGKDKNAVAPRFSLEQGQVIGFYPPQGHTAFNNILPHIIFRDQHLPWIRSGPNAAPWLALLVFTNDELTLQPSERLLPPGREQDSAGGVSFTFQEIFDAQNQARITSPFSQNDPETIDLNTTSNFVFVPGDVFRSLFSKYNHDGSPMEMKNGDTPDPTRYKYLAHLRKISTTGLLQKDDKPPTQPYSIVVSHRTAPVDLKETTSVSVHLVSLENVENVTADGKRVAMCSLHSWTYNVFPPGTQTFQDKLIHLGNTLDVLRPPLKGVIDTLGSASSLPPDAVSRLEVRVRAGYTLVRDTGNQTIAFTRSPCVPGRVAPIPNLASTSEVDYQTLDQHLGIVDITYSSAWQLGKSLAVADRSVTAALGHLGTKIGDVALKKARLEFEDTETAAEGLLDFSTTDPDFLSRLEHHCVEVASALSTGTDDTTSEEHGDPDLQQVFTFFLHLLFLYSVPTHYLLPDPALLPEESLRFFSIDKNWTDALIDGALSVTNVNIRKAITKSFQAFLAKPIPAVGYPPQVPTYGMLLRSGIVSQFPDLSIRAPNPNPDDLRAPILRQTVIADDTLLVLFDRVPGPLKFRTLTIQMPPREDHFCVGSEIDGDNLTIHWKRIYAHAPRDEPFPHLVTSKYQRNDIERPTDPKVYDWPSRTLNMDAYTATAFAHSQDNIQAGMFNEAAKTSVFTAIELSGSVGIDLADKLYAYPIAMAFGRSQLLSLELLAAPQTSLDEGDMRYDYGMWPIHEISTQKPPDNAYPIPCGLKYDIDIVFSIIRKHNWETAPNKNLQKVEIELLFHGSKGIMTTYEGSGVYLASNMRWTEFVEFVDHSDYRTLKVGIVPRDNEKGWSPLKHNKELTFVLKGCRIVGQPNCGVAVVTEYYDGEEASDFLGYKLVSPKDG